MKLIPVKNYDEMSLKAADFIAAQLMEKKDSVLGLATGSTMIGLYGELVAKHKRGELDFSQVKTLNLDEYIGLSSSDVQSYGYYMKEYLFKHVNMKEGNYHIPCGVCQDIEDECRAYDFLIKTLGGIDLQLMGLGVDGHIGFNEPGESFIKDTHFIRLDETTIKANARFFEQEYQVPKHAITMGIGPIMASKKALLCANGKSKAAILKKVLTEPVSPLVPGSILQLHPNLTVIADEEALSEI